MAKEKTQDIPEIAPKVVEHLVKEADEAGVPPVVAKWIIKDAIADGVAPDEVADVVKERSRSRARIRNRTSSSLLRRTRRTRKLGPRSRDLIAFTPAGWRPERG